MTTQIDQSNQVRENIQHRMVSIYSFVSSSFDEETLHQIEGYSSNWETFTCSQCGEEYEVAYAIAIEPNDTGAALARYVTAVRWRSVDRDGNPGESGIMVSDRGSSEFTNMDEQEFVWALEDAFEWPGHVLNTEDSIY